MVEVGLRPLVARDPRRPAGSSPTSWNSGTKSRKATGEKSPPRASVGGLEGVRVVQGRARREHLVHRVGAQADHHLAVPLHELDLDRDARRRQREALLALGRQRRDAAASGSREQRSLEVVEGLGGRLLVARSRAPALRRGRTGTFPGRTPRRRRPSRRAGTPRSKPSACWRRRRAPCPSACAGVAAREGEPRVAGEVAQERRLLWRGRGPSLRGRELERDVVGGRRERTPSPAGEQALHLRPGGARPGRPSARPTARAHRRSTVGPRRRRRSDRPGWASSCGLEVARIRQRGAAGRRRRRP